MTIAPSARIARTATAASSSASARKTQSAPPRRPCWQRHPLGRLLCSFRVRVVAFLALGFIGFFVVVCLLLSATFDAHEANRRALRSFVADAAAPRGAPGYVSLEERRHAFEEEVAAALLRLSPVTLVVDELLRRVLRLVEAVADRSAEEDAAAAGGTALSGSGSNSRDHLLQFTFGTHNRAIAGAVGSDVHALRMVVDRAYSAAHMPLSPSPSSPLDPDLDAPNLREKLTALYIASMQPAGAKKQTLLGQHGQLTPEEIRFYALQPQQDAELSDPTHPAVFPMSLLLARELSRWQDDREGYEAWMVRAGVALDLPALEAKAAQELEEGSVHAQHWHQAHPDAAPSPRKCFLPLFVPEGAVRQCRCVDTQHEHAKGCRRAQAHVQAGEWLGAEASVAHRWRGSHTAASFLTPPLSRREALFALPEIGALLGGGDAAEEKSLSPPERRARDDALRHSALWNNAPLPWVAGAHVFEEPSSDSDNAAFQQLREVCGWAHGHGVGAGIGAGVARFVAGPSSTTSTIMQLARFLGMGSAGELALLRLSLVAYLVPGRDHSLLEVLVGGGTEQFGLGPSMEQMRAAATEETRVRADGPAAASRHFATALPFTHLLPADVALPPYCSEGDAAWGELTVARLSDAVAHELLESHSPPSLQQEVRALLSSASPSEEAGHGSCSPFVAAHWRLLGLGELHARHCAARFPGADARRSDIAALHDCGGDDDARVSTVHPCNPTVMLQFLVRNLYSY